MSSPLATGCLATSCECAVCLASNRVARAYAAYAGCVLLRAAVGEASTAVCLGTQAPGLHARLPHCRLASRTPAFAATAHSHAHSYTLNMETGVLGQAAPEGHWPRVADMLKDRCGCPGVHGRQCGVPPAVRALPRARPHRTHARTHTRTHARPHAHARASHSARRHGAG
jgi:hypothetical protein